MNFYRQTGKMAKDPGDPFYAVVRGCVALYLRICARGQTPALFSGTDGNAALRTLFRFDAVSGASLISRLPPCSEKGVTRFYKHFIQFSRSMAHRTAFTNWRMPMRAFRADTANIFGFSHAVPA